MALYEAMFTQYSICAAQVRDSFFPNLTDYFRWNCSWIFFHVLYAAVFTVVLHFHCHPTFGAYCSANGSLYRSALLSISEMELPIIKVEEIRFFLLEFMCVLLLCMG